MVERVNTPLPDAPTTQDVVAAAYAIAHMEPVVAQQTAEILEQIDGMTQVGKDVLHISARIAQEIHSLQEPK